MDLKTEHGRAQLYASGPAGAALVRDLEQADTDRQYAILSNVLDATDRIDLDKIFGDAMQEQFDALLQVIVEDTGEGSALHRMAQKFGMDLAGAHAQAEINLAEVSKMLGDVVYEGKKP
jgi:hypothetical protein